MPPRRAESRRVDETKLREARREARVDAIVFVLVALALLAALAFASYVADWELLGVGWWVWLLIALPELVLAGELVLSSRIDDHRRSHRTLQVFFGFVVVGSASALTLLVAALVTEKASELTGAQLLTSGGVLWLTNAIVFGLWFWTVDDGGPVERAMKDRETPDFLFPQDDDPERARPGWYPRLEDYTYVALTNAIAFSPTDTMPLTRWAKVLMGAESAISVIAVLLVAARAVNVLGA